MNENTKRLAVVAVMYVALAGAVLGAVYITGSAWCLWAFALTPDISIKGDSK